MKWSGSRLRQEQAIITEFIIDGGIMRTGLFLADTTQIDRFVNNLKLKPETRMEQKKKVELSIKQQRAILYLYENNRY